MADLGLGQSAGIVALAAFVIKETFAFVRPFKRKDQKAEIDWIRMATLMNQNLQPLETCMKQMMERLDYQGERLEQQSERSNQLANEMLIEQRKFNDLFLRYISRQEGLEEGRRERNREN